MPALIDKVAEAAATYTPSDPVEFERLKDVVGWAVGCDMRVFFLPL